MVGLGVALGVAGPIARTRTVGRRRVLGVLFRPGALLLLGRALLDSRTLRLLLRALLRQCIWLRRLLLRAPRWQGTRLRWLWARVQCRPLRLRGVARVGAGARCGRSVDSGATAVGLRGARCVALLQPALLIAPRIVVAAVTALIVG